VLLDVLNIEKINPTIRSIYVKSTFLRSMRRKYLFGKNHVLPKFKFWANTKTNTLALRALSGRRWAVHGKLDSAVDPNCAWPMLDISVVSFNSERWVETFFTSLVAQAFPLSKINLCIIDHGSQDDTILRIESFLLKSAPDFASVKLIRQENLGYGSGCHRAMSFGESEYCLVTNLDIQFFNGSLTEVVNAALGDHDKHVASWELRQIPYEHPKYYDPITQETNWSEHACILIRRSAYDNVGGHDSQIFMYVEDVELSYRFRSYGYVLRYVPKAVVQHFTDEPSVQMKPLQYVGRAVGNVYIRLRYGDFLAKLCGFAFYGVRFLRPSPFRGAKKILLKKIVEVANEIQHVSGGKGSSAAYFPIYGNDYELARCGAFYEVQPSQCSDLRPLVTVIMRTYRGRAALLKQAMQSVMNQTYDAIELVIVEDGGNSQLELVNSFSAAKVGIRFIANPKLGRSAAGNAGLAAAEGSHVMFLDDDDLIFADHIEILVSELMRNPKLSAAYALAMEVQTKVDALNSAYVEEQYYSPDMFHQEWNYDVLLDHNFIPIQAILFKRELYEQRGGFDTELDQLEDWNLWLRYGHGSIFQFVPKTTSMFRSPADNRIRSQRHELLNNSYDNAKRKALLSLGSRGA